MTITMDNPWILKTYAAKGTEELQLTYDEWASTYNTHMVEENYVAPSITAEITAQHGATNGIILDAGCGSGIVGFELARRGAKTIDGIDLSKGMLKVAEKNGAYRNLAVADLSQKVNQGDDTYDAVVCVGTLTHGHVGPNPALSEFVRITKKDGFIVATILPQLWETKGFEAEVERLELTEKVVVISNDVNSYRRGQDAHFLVLRVL